MSLATRSPIAERPPTVGVEDLVIVPLVVVAVAVSKLLKGVLSILIYVLDYAFPILLQLMRIPLLAARLFGDGMERCCGCLYPSARRRRCTLASLPKPRRYQRGCNS